MINLIKYEIRKQLISKIIIVTIIVVLEIAFLIGTLITNEDIITVTNGIFIIASFLGIFYVASEPAVVFENDLSKKQGYLLYMTPNSSKRIAGAKVLAGTIQLSILFSMVIGMFTMNDNILSWYSGRYVNQLDEMFNAFGDVGFSFIEFINTGFMLLLMWIDFITLTFLVTSISYAYIVKGKINTFFSIVLFVILFIGEALLIIYPIMMSFNGVVSVNTSLVTVSITLFAVPAVINYYLTTVMLDKKVSL